MDVPRWSHAMYAVQSVPNWKIFVFGGIGGDISDTNRQGTFMNDVSIFDTGTERWMHPDIQGEPPLPRGDTQLEYYQQVRIATFPTFRLRRLTMLVVVPAVFDPRCCHLTFRVPIPHTPSDESDFRDVNTPNATKGNRGYA